MFLDHAPAQRAICLTRDESELMVHAQFRCPFSMATALSPRCRTVTLRRAVVPATQNLVLLLVEFRKIFAGPVL